MALEVGSRLGHLYVTALIGEGGMGQVYRALDTKVGGRRIIRRKDAPWRSARMISPVKRSGVCSESRLSLLGPWPATAHGYRQTPELRLVEQRDAVPLGAQSLDLHQLQASIAPGGLLGIGTPPDDDRCPR